MRCSPFLLQLLSGPSADVQVREVTPTSHHIRTSFQLKCLWALGNFAGDGIDCRNQLTAQGLVPPLLVLLQVCCNDASTMPSRHIGHAAVCGSADRRGGSICGVQHGAGAWC